MHLNHRQQIQLYARNINISCKNAYLPHSSCINWSHKQQTELYASNTNISCENAYLSHSSCIKYDF